MSRVCGEGPWRISQGHACSIHAGTVVWHRRGRCWHGSLRHLCDRDRIIIGYVSLAVGWLVGKAILKGSGGVGGRRYQITAVLLTYSAVSMAAVPIWIHYAGKQKQAQEQDLAARQRQLESEFGQQKQTVIPVPHKARPSMASALAMLALIGIASPFVEIWEGGPNFGSIMGIVILIVGIRIAWRITAGRPLEIYGPFASSTQPTP